MNSDGQNEPNSYPNSIISTKTTGPEYALIVEAIKEILKRNDISEIFETVCLEGCRIFGAERSVIIQVRVDEPSRSEILSSHNIPQNVRKSLEESPCLPILHDVFENKCVKVFSGLKNESNKFDAKSLGQKGLCTICTIPLLDDGCCSSALFLCHLTPKEYSKKDWTLAEIFGNLTSSAIEKARLVRCSEKRATRLEIVNQIAEVLKTSLNPDDLFKKIIHEIKSIVPCERYLIGSCENGERRNWYVESKVEISHSKSLRVTGPSEWIREVYENKKIINIPDLHKIKQSRRANELKKAGFQSVLVVPVFQGNKCIAHLSLANTKKAGFTYEHEEFLLSISNHIGLAIRNANNFQASQDQALRFSLLNELNQELAENLSLNDILTKITNASLTLIGSQHARIFLFDEDTSELKLRASAGMIPKVKNGVDSFKPGEGFSGIVYQTKQSAIVPDIQNDSRIVNSKWAAEHGVHGLISVPIVKNNYCYGVISCLSQNIGDFNDEHLQLLKSLASKASIAIQNACLLSQTQERANRLLILNNLNREISENLDLFGLFSRIADAAVEILKADHSSIFLFDEDAREFYFQTSRGKLPYPSDYPRIVKWDESIIAKVGLECVNILDAQNPYLFWSNWARENEIHSFSSQPLMRMGKCIGVLICMSQKIGAFNQEDMDLLSALASQASVAIGNAILYDDAEKKGRRLSALVNSAQRLTKGLELSSVLQSVSEAAATLFNGEAGFRILNGKHLIRAGGTPGALETMKKERLLLGESLSGKVAQTGVPIITADIRSDPRILPSHRESVKGEGKISLMAIPVKVEGRILGTLSIFRDKGYIFDQEDFEIAMSLGDQIAIAIENAKLHEKAHRSRNFFQSVVKDNSDAIMVMNRKRQIIQWNSGAEKLYGYTEHEAIGQSIDLILSDEEKGKDKGCAVANGRETAFFEGKRVKKDGTKIPVSITLSPVKDVSGRWIATSAVHKDLSEFRRAESAAKKAKEAAEAASRAKSEFLSTMSHELRSPLNAVIGFSDLLLMDSGEEKVRHIVPKIRDSGRYLLSLIEEILDFDRIERGKVRLNVKSIPINELVSGVVESWHPRMPDNFSIRLQVDPSCGTIHCDETRIKQILNNLIDNAVKYSPEGGCIRVRTESSLNEIYVKVSDEGMGIGPEEKKAIFSRFHQLASGLKRRAGGLGIGLALAQELINMHEGQIWVESEVERGSTFSFALPKLLEIPAESSLPSDEEKAPAIEGPWSGRTILIVDDLEHYHEYMKLLMSSAAQVFSAQNGKEAIESVRNHHPNLILMDLRMPVMDGLDAIRFLKSDPATKDIPILAVTAQVMEQDKENAFQAGADGFVTKPIDVEDFKEEMDRVMKVRA